MTFDRHFTGALVLVSLIVCSSNFVARGDVSPRRIPGSQYLAGGAEPLARV